MENAILSTKTYAANGESDVFRIGGGVVELQGRVTGAGAVAATLTLYATNTPKVAASFKKVGDLALAGNNDVLDSKMLTTALAYGKIVVTGLSAGGSLDASASSARSGTGASDSSPMPIKTGASQNYQVQIANGQSLSAALDLGNYRLGRIGLPAAFEGTKLSFQTSVDGQTWRDLYDAYGEYTVNAGPNRSVVPDLTMFASARYIKIRSGTSAAAAAVAAIRTIDVTTLA